ncbi:acyltransferase [Streptomyces sp. ISL-99]|uniref:acyltransferase family protein n=1 Tax=Streptomyces sp. ISL-99 TaxID=2819193 RepID=UPI001BE50250|nr:acyltransferase [Streptomyces sp. ISL-99]MBT2526258.1 acyltransferase [Streptomyces sp. ISL-99]
MTIHRPVATPDLPGAVLVQRAQKLPSLTGLRFFAAFLVVLSHVGVNLLPRVAPDQIFAFRLLHEAGAFGVSFFFILSGFVLTWVARDDDSVGRFWRRRFFKIYPNHLVTVLAALLLAAAAGHALTARDAGATLLLVQTWIPDMKLQFNLWSNTPTWSLSCELLFYLAFPWLLKLLRKIPPARLWLAFGVVYAVIWAVPLVASWLPKSGGIHPGTGQNWFSMWFMTFFPPVRMLEFVLGIVVALIVVNGRWIRLPLAVALVFPLVPFVATGYMPNELGFVALTALPLAFLVAATAAADIGSSSGRTWLGGRTMVFLGEISFALYLVHWLVVVYGWIGRTSPTWGAKPGAPSTWPEVLGLAGLTIATSLVLAWLLYVLVERPVMRRWSRPRAPRADEVLRPAPDRV